jgi:hypothetical protein
MRTLQEWMGHRDFATTLVSTSANSRTLHSVCRSQLASRARPWSASSGRSSSASRQPATGRTTDASGRAIAASTCKEAQQRPQRRDQELADLGRRCGRLVHHERERFTSAKPIQIKLAGRVCLRGHERADYVGVVAPGDPPPTVLRAQPGAIATWQPALPRVQEWMGHSDIQTTMRYLDYAPKEGDAALVADAFALEPASPAERPA